MLGKSSGGIASVVEGTYKGRKVNVAVCLSDGTAEDVLALSQASMSDPAA
jgi:hypothetical protein